MPRDAILILDQGTHASRAMVFNTRGQSLFSVKCEIGLQRPESGRVEQDPHQVLSSVREVLLTAVSWSRKEGVTLQSAGLCTQRSSVVAWHRETGEAMSPVISWQDTRARTFVEALSAHAPDLQERTGLRLSSHYGASKMRWMLDELPAVRQAEKAGNLCMGSLASFLLFHLAEGNPLLVDHANAARTSLMNLRALDWDPELARLFGVPLHCMPECREMQARYGLIQGTEIPLRVVTGDQSAAYYGFGNIPPGDVVVNVGTGAFVLAPVEKSNSSSHALLTAVTYSTADNKEYALEGTVNGAGAALSWLQERVTLDSGTFSAWPGVEQVPLFLNSVGGLGAPWWRPGPQPRLLDQGGTLATLDPAVALAAVMESIIFLIQANIDQLRQAGCGVSRIRIGGGVSRDTGFCQRLADLSGCTVLRSEQPELTGQGLAWLVAGRPADWHFGSDTVFTGVQQPDLQTRYTNFLHYMESDPQ